MQRKHVRLDSPACPVGGRRSSTGESLSGLVVSRRGESVGGHRQCLVRCTSSRFTTYDLRFTSAAACSRLGSDFDSSEGPGKIAGGKGARRAAAQRAKGGLRARKGGAKGRGVD